jgi:hypothetical protein
VLAAAAQPAAQEGPAGVAVPGQPGDAKLHPELRELARQAAPANQLSGPLQAAAQEAVWVEVIAGAPAGGLDLERHFLDGKVLVRPALAIGGDSIQIAFGRIAPYNLNKLAALPQVTAVLPVHTAQTQRAPLPELGHGAAVAERGPQDWAALRAQAEQLRSGSLDWAAARADGDGQASQPRDWYEVRPQGPHKAEVAWARGYRGEGVTISVVDEGVDPAHPDLMGTQKIYSSTVAPQYNGWPMVFSPYSMFLWAQDAVFGATNVADGFPGIHYVDTSATRTPAPCGPNLSCFPFTPLLGYGVPGDQHTYVISDSMSSSGIVHVGTHPDDDLRDWVWGEKPALDPGVPQSARQI